MSIGTNGQAQSAVGHLESITGEAIGRQDMKARGDANRLEGEAKEMIGAAQDKIGAIAGKAWGSAAELNDRVRETYGAAADTVQDVKSTIEPFVREKPYVALLCAFALGFVASRLLAPVGPKVVYVKPRA